MPTDERDSKDRPAARCPICKAPTERAFRPFCSRRCADVDLSRWLRGSYAIPAQDADDDEDGDAASEAAIAPRSDPDKSRAR